MGCKLVLLSFLVACFVLVDSYPYPDGNGDGAYQFGRRPDNPLFYPPRQNANPIWPRRTTITRNPENALLSRDHNNFNDNNIQQVESNHFVRTGNNFGFGQQINTQDNVTPVAPLQNTYKPPWYSFLFSTPAPIQKNNLLWNTAYKPQQNNIFGRSYEGNNFAQSFATSYANANQNNYGNGRSQYQPPSMTPKPFDIFNRRDKLWRPPNQVNIITTPRPGDFLPWPIADNLNGQVINIYEPNEYNIPTETIIIEDTPNPVSKDIQELILTSPTPLYTQTVTPKNYLIVHVNGSFENVDNLNDIVMDENNVAHIKSRPPPNDVLAIVEVEEENEKKEQPLLEVPYDTGIEAIPRDTEQSTDIYENYRLHQAFIHSSTQMPIEETTYDMSYFKPEFILPIQSTTENSDSTVNSTPQDTITNGNIDENSFIMQYTTENYVGDANGSTTSRASDDTIDGTNIVATEDTNTISSTTDSITNTGSDIATDIDNVTETHSATDSSSDITTNSNINSINFSTTSNIPSNLLADSTSNTYSVVNTDDNKYEHSYQTKTESYRYVDHDFDDIYNAEETKYNSNTQLESTQPFSNLEDIDNYFDDLNAMHYDVPDWNSVRKAYENNNSNNEEPGQIYDENNDGASQLQDDSESLGNKDTKNNENYEADMDDSPADPDTLQLRGHKRIDASELQTTSEPAVWFRPDESFWDSVKKGEQGFDALTVFDVNCKPKLIERTTTIHHHANGTRTVEYVETVWDGPDAKSPREVKTRRDFIEEP